MSCCTCEWIGPRETFLLLLFFTSDVQINCFLFVFFQRVLSKDHICSIQCFSFSKFCSFRVWFLKKNKTKKSQSIVWICENCYCWGCWTVDSPACFPSVNLSTQPADGPDWLGTCDGVTYSSHKSDQFCRTGFFFPPSVLLLWIN